MEHLTRREMEKLLSLPVPGADEVMGLKRLMDLMEEGTFVFYDLRRKHRDYEKAFGRRDRADEFLISLKTSTARLRNLLRSEKTEFVVVTAAERLMIEETKDLVSQLRSFGINVKHLIVNKLFPDLDSDFSRIRREQEQRLVQEIRNTFPQLEIAEVHLQPTEPRGIDNLCSFASLLYS